MPHPLATFTPPTPMTQPNDWITDRRPTASDGDGDGDVLARYHPDNDDHCYLHWSYVGEATPWKHCADWQPPAAPEPTKPALAVGQRWRRRDGEVVTIFRSGSIGFRAGECNYDSDGTAPFGSAGIRPQYDLIELLPAEPIPTPRKFASLTRTIADFGHVIDAIDDDGVAWWMTLATHDSGPEWHQLMPLPGREVVG